MTLNKNRGIYSSQETFVQKPKIYSIQLSLKFSGQDRSCLTFQFFIKTCSGDWSNRGYVGVSSSPTKKRAKAKSGSFVVARFMVVDFLNNFRLGQCAAPVDTDRALHSRRVRAFLSGTFFDDISISRTISSGTYRYEKEL